jgi:hypothetical protein
MNEIKIKVFKGKLYRANKTKANKNIFAAVNYRGAPRKYFTLRKNELNAYTKKGTTYKKTWNVLSDLRLVDILDPQTRQNLEELFTTRREKMALNNAFPITNTGPSRNSSNVNIDDIVLDKICELGYDGYYMETISAFHSEVGLCSEALNKLKLAANSEKIVAPENIKKARRTSINFNRNTMKKKLFNNAMNINNINQPLARTLF